MSKASAKLYKALRIKGCRITAARKEVIETLSNAKEPLSIQMITSNVAADEASVYRSVALFLKLGVLEEIVEEGKVRRYALAHDHHHHIVCRTCGYVEHIPCRDVQQVTISHSHFSVIESHDVTYYGRCRKCKTV